MRYGTATDYGPGICIRVRIPYRTVRICILILLWRIKIKLLGGQIRVQYSNPDLPGLVRIIRASHSNDVRCPRWRGQSRKTDYRTEVRFKDKNLFKNQSFCLLRFTESPDPRTANPGLGSGPKSGSGLTRWHKSGGGSAARRWIRPGLRYH